MEVAVSVTTPCIALMSLVSRDWSSPPRVRVKKLSGIRCRWLNTPVRRLCMICWPISVASSVWITPNTAEMSATPTIPAHSASSSGTSWSGIAVSMRCLMMNGLARPTAEVATINATMVNSRPRNGWKRAAIRPRLTGCSSSWRRSAALFFKTAP